MKSQTMVELLSVKNVMENDFTPSANDIEDVTDKYSLGNVKEYFKNIFTFKSYDIDKFRNDKSSNLQIDKDSFVTRKSDSFDLDVKNVVFDDDMGRSDSIESFSNLQLKLLHEPVDASEEPRKSLKDLNVDEKSLSLDSDSSSTKNCCDITMT